jgi:TRAP-type C4-dicarboxylate transport system permease small subunit
MQKLFNRCENVLLYSAVLSTFVMMCLTTADAGGRYIFNRPIIGAYEVTQSYLMVAAVFLALGYAYRQGANIRVTFLVDRLPSKVKLIVNHFVQIASMLYGVVLVVATIQQALRNIASGATLSGFPIPLGPAYAIVPVGLFFMSFLMLLDIRKVRAGKSPLFKEESPTG